MDPDKETEAKKIVNRIPLWSRELWTKKTETIIAGQNLGKSLLAGRGEGAQSALEGGVCCAPVGPVVVPEPGPAGGEEGAPLAPTLEHLRAPVIGSHVGPQHRWFFILTASGTDSATDPDPSIIKQK